MLARIVAALLGIAALVVTAILTGGGTFCAFLGVFVAAIIASRKRRRLSRRASWLGAVAGSAIALAGFGVFAFRALPPGTYSQIQRSSDSASATAKPPAWLERVAPGTGARMARKPSMPTGVARAFQLWASITGAVIGLVIVAAIVGTVGWLVTLPLAFAWRGQWLPWVGGPVSPL
jgi:hypothetical protein